MLAVDEKKSEVEVEVKLPSVDDLVFFEKRIIDPEVLFTTVQNLRGSKSDQEGFYFPYLDFNKFSTEPEPIPADFTAMEAPIQWWIKSFMLDPARKHETPITTLPIQETHKRYFVHNNGGRPYCVYVLPDNSVFVFSFDETKFIWKNDFNEEYMHDGNDCTSWMWYTKMVWSCNKATQVHIGKHEVDSKEADNMTDGNTFLIQTRNPREYVFINGGIVSFMLTGDDYNVTSYSIHAGHGGSSDGHGDRVVFPEIISTRI
jgi:hypothetical protein